MNNVVVISERGLAVKRTKTLTLCALVLAGTLMLSGCSGGPHGLIYQSGLTVWILDPGQKAAKPLVQSAGYAIEVSNDLKQIAYSTDSHDLWVANIDGTGARELIIDQLREAKLIITRISWSPKDERLAVFATPGDSPESNLEKVALYMADLSTNKVKAVATGVAGFAWSWAEDQLVVNKQFDPVTSPGVYLVSADGSISRQLFGGLVEPFVVASPVSNQAVFVAAKSEHAPKLRLLMTDLSSGTIADLLQDDETPIQSIGELAWSADGKRLAFTASLPGKDNLAISALFVVDPQTHVLQGIGQNIRGPLAWSPTGQVIATTIMSSTEGIYQVSLETGDIQKLTDDRLSTPMNFEWR